ncbi:LysR family transcriptional regulator [Variovorax sp. RA8]|uniref:LysR family transcriptional regulator n=1 Tax=Variovorax sp. (strain JCM 16519 / RA8) TaxID=662548 RepID=UPI0013A55E8E|nr:LysR substrate-binding domain-containing protein [Variovorax sp. RA8]
MDLKSLRYFVAVAEARSVGKAAQRLHMAQPPLTVQIRNLEAQIGTPLFLRESTGMRLTDAGSALFARAREALALAHEGFEAARAVGAGRRGRLTVGYMFSLGYAILPKLVPLLHRSMPDVELQFVEMSAATCEAQVLQHKVTVGLCMPPIQRAEVANTIVGSQPLRLAVPANSSLARLTSIPMARLQDQKMIALPSLKEDADTSMVAALLRRHQVTVQVVERVETVHAALALVLAGEGCAVVPACAAAGLPSGVVVRKLAGVIEGFDVAVSRRHDVDSPFIEPFIAAARQALQ